MNKAATSSAAAKRPRDMPSSRIKKWIPKRKHQVNNNGNTPQRRAAVAKVKKPQDCAEPSERPTKRHRAGGVAEQQQPLGAANQELCSAIERFNGRFEQVVAVAGTRGVTAADIGCSTPRPLASMWRFEPIYGASSLELAMLWVDCERVCRHHESSSLPAIWREMLAYIVEVREATVFLELFEE